MRLNELKKSEDSTIAGIAERFYVPMYCAVLLLLAFFCFYKLGASAVQDWDEARHGVSAYEMIKNGEYILNTYLYSPDYFNLKPVLSFWPIVLAFRLFGVSTFSLRFFSALATFGTGALLGRFARKIYGRLESLLAVGIFTCIPQLFSFHTARSGDADGLFTLCFTGAMLLMLELEDKPRNITWCGLCFSIAFLAKSFHALFIAAIGGLYLIVSGHIKHIKAREWASFAAASLLPIAAWAALRYRKDKTLFLGRMIQADVLNRVVDKSGAGESDMWYLIKQLLSANRLTLLLALVAAAALAVLILKKKTIKNRVAGFVLWVLLPLTVYTVTLCNYSWYLMPLYPALALLAAKGIGAILKLPKRLAAVSFAVLLLTGASCAVNACGIYSTIANPQTILAQEFIKNELHGQDELRGRKIYFEGLTPYWPQGAAFIAETELDAVCLEGGAEAFCNEENSGEMLMINVIPYAEKLGDMPPKTTVLVKTEDYVLLERGD